MKKVSTLFLGVAASTALWAQTESTPAPSPAPEPTPSEAATAPTTEPLTTEAPLPTETAPQGASPETTATTEATPLVPQAIGDLSKMAKLSEFMQQLASNIDIDSDGDSSFDMEKGVVTWQGNVRIRVQGSEIYSDKAEFDTEREELRVSGNVSIYREGLLYRGETATYNLQTGQMDSQNLRSGAEPIFFQAGDFRTTGSDVSKLEANNAEFTTDDSDSPSWHIKADKLTIYPEDRIVLNSPKFYVGDTPVFWLPYLARPLDEELGYQFTPGYKGSWGAYWLNRYGTMWGDHSIIQYNLDYRSERGLAGGIDLLSRRWTHSDSFGKAQFYYANDDDPSQSFVANRREDRTDISSDRYRINFNHRVYLPGPEESTLYLDFDINKLSDEFFYEDFFPGEFRLDPEPDNYISLVKQHERGELSLTAKFELNDFYTNEERLPEVALDLARQPIMDTGLFYWGRTSFSILEENRPPKLRQGIQTQIDKLQANLAEGLIDPNEANTLLDGLQDQIDPAGFTRFFSYHEVLYPFSLGGAFNLTPKVGVGFSNYSDVEGPAPDDSSRGLFHAGLDFSFKASKMYEDIKIPALGVNGLLHVVQPYLSWSYLDADPLGDDFGEIDRLVPSTRLRPLDIPQFTAIDDLRSWNKIRLGIENRLITRRGEGSQPWLTSNTYVETYMDDPEFDRDFSNLFEELVWSPLPWLRLNFGTQFPAFDGDAGFTEINTGLTFMPSDWFEFQVGHRYLESHPFFEDSNLVDVRTYTRINDNWGLSTLHRYEAEDSTLEVQQYSLHRDLTTWSAALGFVLRDNRGKEETGVVFSLSLKDFPGVSLPLDLDASGSGQ